MWNHTWATLTFYPKLMHLFYRHHHHHHYSWLKFVFFVYIWFVCVCAHVHVCASLFLLIFSLLLWCWAIFVVVGNVISLRYVPIPFFVWVCFVWLCYLKGQLLNEQLNGASFWSKCFHFLLLLFFCKQYLRGGIYIYAAQLPIFLFI